ncbi:hypothetical protein BN946_scf184884.g16 [Trametes cinnabarina]|uniref:Mitochondrial carrier n=1 Tax=Pycnoporus cinnabarinus TaxID=5643 RepID=A0A060S5X9_PYCCI|nr:hypothetical protein BN946_scf184884.g16 [Trametes cinnabarina]
MLNPQVAHMDVMMFGWSDASAETIASELNRFGRNSDQLRSINIACPSSLPIEEAVLALAYRHQHLRTFIYTWSRGLSVDTIAHLSKMHSLQEVAIRADQKITSRIAELANARGPSFFSSLNALVLHMESLELCKEWLEIIGAPTVNSLTLTVDQVPTAKEFTTFLVHLVEVRQGTLNKLRFVSMTPCPRGSSRHTVMPITLEPLLRLNITHLQLEPGMPIQIDDTFIERMARAWPRLQTLELNAEWRRYSEQPPLVTVPGLLPLTDHCPKLTSLAITFNSDVSAFEERVEAGERPAGGRSFDLNKTFKLGVGLMSVETAWRRVGQDDIPDELDDEAEEMAEAWSQVHRSHRQLTAAIVMDARTLNELLAGSVGGAAQVIVGQPLDTIKTRAQTAPAGMFVSTASVYTVYHSGKANSTTFNAVEGSYGHTCPNPPEGGILRFVQSPLIGIAGVNSLLFAAYGVSKRLISPFPQLSLKEIAAAGGIAGAVNAVLASPVEMFKVRMQGQYGSPSDKRLRAVVTEMWRDWGFRKGIMRGYWVTVAREIPAYAGFYTAFEFSKRKFAERYGSQIPVWALLASGSTGGVRSFHSNVSHIQSSVTSLDRSLIGWRVILWSRVQLRATPPEGTPIQYIARELALIVKESGVSGLFRGLTPSLLRSIPAAASTFAAFELTREYLKEITGV